MAERSERELSVKVWNRAFDKGNLNVVAMIECDSRDVHVETLQHDLREAPGCALLALRLAVSARALQCGAGPCELRQNHAKLPQVLKKFDLDMHFWHTKIAQDPLVALRHKTIL